MQYFIYFLIAVFSTTVGSLTGMGGGIIIKPVMDVIGEFDVQTIGVISSIAVFSMSLVSVLKQIKAKTKIPFDMAIPLAVSSVFGGFIGQYLLDYIVKTLAINLVAAIIQNIILAVLVFIVVLYMKNKSRIAGKHIKSILVTVAVGIFLGCVSSFLGIGGGPINVALIIYLFSFDTKTATVCSLITVFFAQLSKLITTAVSTGFACFDLSVAPVMVIGAVLGGFVGAALNKKCSERTVEKAFNGVQLLVLIIAIINISKGLFQLIG